MDMTENYICVGMVQSITFRLVLASFGNATERGRFQDMRSAIGQKHWSPISNPWDLAAHWKYGWIRPISNNGDDI